MSQIIFSTRLKGYQPVIWYGKPVYEHSSQIKALLKEHLGKQLAELLADPHINAEAKKGVGKAYWMSSFLGKNPKSVVSLPKSKQEQIKEKLASHIKQIHNFAEKLSHAQDERLREYSEMLIQALEIPGEEYVFVDENNAITLTCWGFTSKEAEKSGFRLSKVLPATKPIQEYTEEEPLKEKAYVESLKRSQTNQQTSNNIPDNKTEKKRKKFNWMWLLLILAAIAAFFMIYHFINNVKTPNIVIYIPDQAEKFKPIDPEKIIPNPDDPYRRKIVSNRLNMVVTKNTNVEKFNKQFIKAHKNEHITIAYYDTLIKYIQLEVPDSNRNAIKHSIKQQHPEIKLVWDEAIFSHAYLPNDPAFAKKKNWWGYNKIGIEKAWAVSTGDSNVVVAIIDDGFDLTHPEFANKVVHPWNVPDHSVYVNTGKKNMFHGTHVASTAVGNANNETGLCGIAPNCKLMPIQVADSIGNISFTSVICGILYAIVKEADVINISLGMNVSEPMKKLPIKEQKSLINTLYPDESEFWEDLFNYTEENNITVVIAAGNSNIISGLDPMHRSGNIIVVSALDTLLGRANFSNFGDYTTVSAPGVEIYSAVPDNQFDYLDGTSMASPIVTGACALIKSEYKGISNSELKEILIETSIQVNSLDIQRKVGPLIQIDSALTIAKSYINKDSIRISKNKNLN